MSPAMSLNAWDYLTLPWDFSAQTRVTPRDLSTITTNRLKLTTNRSVAKSPNLGKEIPQLTDSGANVLKTAVEG
jgi:hypothetical protein